MSDMTSLISIYISKREAELFAISYRSKLSQKLINQKMEELAKRLIRNPKFLFFSSASILTFIICFPRISIIPIIAFCSLYLSTLQDEKERSNDHQPESNENQISLTQENPHLTLLQLLDQPNSKNTEFIDTLNRTYFPKGKMTTDQISLKYAFDLLSQITEAKSHGCLFDLDNWLKEIVVKLLPKDTEPEFKYFVSHDVENITKSKNSDWSKYLTLAVKTTPQLDSIPYNEKDYQFPKKYLNRTLKFPKYTKERHYKTEYCEFEAKKLWLLIHGDASFFTSYNYSEWYDQNTKKPYWLIPFALYRWWTPNDSTSRTPSDVFINKLADFISLPLKQNLRTPSLALNEKTRIRMKDDILYWFLLSYVGSIISHDRTSAYNVPELSRVFSNIPDKFLSYCIAGFLKSENIISINDGLYEDIVIQCIDFILTNEKMKKNWTVAAFVLQREISSSRDKQSHSCLLYQQRLRALLDSFCGQNNNDEKDEKLLIDTQNQFRIPESDVYEVKGEKLINQAINNQRSIVESYSQFSQGLNWLLKANKIQRILDILMDYFLLTVQESGKSQLIDLSRKQDKNIKTIFTIYDEINEKLNENLELRQQIIDSDNYLILKAIATGEVEDQFCLKVSNILKNNWKSFNLRRLICSLLMRNPKWRQYLYGVDGASLEEIVSYEDDDAFEWWK